jgi:hypothetical protein
MRSIIHHGNSSLCPEVAAGGTCPGHEVDVAEYTEADFQKALEEARDKALSAVALSNAQAYGRGFRRCFEMLVKNREVWILFGAGCYDECRDVLREALERSMPEALKGWDTDQLGLSPDGDLSKDEPSAI